MNKYSEKELQDLNKLAGLKGKDLQNGITAFVKASKRPRSGVVAKVWNLAKDKKTLKSQDVTVNTNTGVNFVIGKGEVSAPITDIRIENNTIYFKFL